MPYEFVFTVKGVERFKCDVATVQCNAVSQATAQQCRNRTAIGSPYCWQHLRSIKHIRVLDSTIPGAGKGLFAVNTTLPDRAVVFRKGDEIVDYAGDIIGAREVQRRYGKYTAPYGIDLDNRRHQFEDGACRRGAGTLVNHPPARRTPNCELVSFQNLRDRVKILATRNILNGDELFADYGKNYHFNERNVSYKTRRRS